MFETLVTGLLTSALGSYIEPKCFSSDKINVAVWSGYVVLKELEVKPEIVADLPAVKLVRGLVGSIELKIPWNRLQSDSVVATLDDVYLILRTEEDIDAVMREMDEFTLKKKLLEELYAQTKRQEQTTNEVEGGSNEEGFAARLVNKIVDNLELHIRRIHIRIEDHSTGEHPFAVGLTIESVHVQSTNSDWQPSYVDTSNSNEPRIFKVVDLNHLSVYCNPDCELQRDHLIDFATCSAEEFTSAISRSIPKRFDDRHFHHMQLYPSHQQHHFILKPVDASARLIVNRDVFDANVPNFEVDVNIFEVAFRLEESQYCDMLYLATALQLPHYYTKYQRYRKFRPQATVLEEPAKWWRYVIASVVEDVKVKKQQWTWNFIEKRREDRKHYKTLWQNKSRQLLEFTDADYVDFDSDDNDGDINANREMVDDDGKIGRIVIDYSDLSNLSPLEIDKELEEIERRRSIEDVLLFRYLADLAIRKHQASRATHDRRRLPTPPPHISREFSDSASVDTDLTESSMPGEVRYRSWGAWMFNWTSKLAASSTVGKIGQSPCRTIPEVELRELFKILEEPSRRLKKRVRKVHDLSGQDNPSEDESQVELSELFRITVTLQRGSLTLASDPETNNMLLRDDPNYGRIYTPTDFLLGTFSQLQLAAVAKDETMFVDMSLQSIEAFDESADSSAFSRLLTRKQNTYLTGDVDDVNANKLSGVVFLMSLEMNPLNSSADASLFIHMEPLEIVMSPTARCWGRLAKYMETPVSLGLWEELEVASFNNIVNFKTRTEAKLKYVMDNRIALAMDLRIQAPVIIIPESDSDYSCARLVVDLGRINFRTDRLCQMDNKRENIDLTDYPPSSRSVPEFLRSPPYFRGVDPNTSFVQQLYDEGERGEGAIRWKEEFYDKFSLCVANINVLLIPYGKTSRAYDYGAGINGMNFQSAPFPVYRPDNYDEEQGYELVERFNINVAVRMSTLPLDATLARFYVHADLPALTFNLSLEKYFQLVALAGRFSVGKTEVLTKSRKYSEGGFGGPKEKHVEMDMPKNDDMTEIIHNFSTSALKKFMVNNADTFPSSLTGVLPGGTIDADNISNAGSDDTWFSITSGTVDLAASALSEGASALETNSSEVDLIKSAVAEHSVNSVSARMREMARKRFRVFSSGEAAKFLDRKLFVCSFTAPIIAVHLKKPRHPIFSSYVSFSNDTNAFDDDPGTLILRLLGFRIRIGQKTLSTQVSASLTSLEVEDVSYAGGLSTQYLVFSCPTIAAPFSISSPSYVDGSFSGYLTQRMRTAKSGKLDSLPQGGGAKGSGGLRSRAFVAQETLLKLAFKSSNDQYSGKEVLREVDVQLGSVQILFDQSYLCSLLELFEEASFQLTSVPAASCGGIDDDLSSLFELTPTIEQEYSIPVNLTESVRADLEQARKNIFRQAPDLLKSTTSNENSHPASIALKLGLRLHSVSLCFSNRGESVASVALLNSQLHVDSDTAGQINVTGLVGDMKVFGLSYMQRSREEDDFFTSDPMLYKSVVSSLDYIEIFGSAATSSTDERHILSVECLLSSNLDAKSPDSAKSEKKAKSRIRVIVQPIRLLAQPEFMEGFAKYLFDGPLYAYYKSESRTNFKASVTERQRHKQATPLNSKNISDPRFSPKNNHLPESLTPFFDAVNASNREARQLNHQTKSFYSLSCGDDADPTKQSHHGNISAKRDDVLLAFSRLLDNFALNITLYHPSVVLPSTSLKERRGLLQPLSSQGIVLDFGTIVVTLQQTKNDFRLKGIACESHQAVITVDSLLFSSLATQTAIIDRSSFQIQCRFSVQAEEDNFCTDRNESALADIDLDFNVRPVCFNVSERNVCLAEEVFYETILPLTEIARSVMQQIDNSEDLLARDPASLSTAHRHSNTTLPAKAGATARWGRLTIHSFFEELKIALISYSEVPSQFELWMKNVLDNSDEISSGESSGEAMFIAQEKRFSHHFMDHRESYSDEISCYVIGELVFVSLEADVIFALNENMLKDDEAHIQCNFSLQKVIFRDKVADSTAFLTNLCGPAPESFLKRSSSRNSVASDSSHLSRGDVFDDLAFYPRSTQDDIPSQVSGRLLSKHSYVDGDGPVVTINTLVLFVSSARCILLPRTLLRLEHFVFNVLLAASKKREELELQLYGPSANNSHGVGGSEWIDADANDTVGERPTMQFSVPSFRLRTDSISESVKDDSFAARSAVMSPLQRMLNSASAAEGRPTDILASRGVGNENGATAAFNTVSALAGNLIVDRKLTIPQWNIDARLSNLQLWVVATDRKAEAAGCVFSCEVYAKLDSALSKDGLPTNPNHNELVNASVMVRNVEVLLGQPMNDESEQEQPIKQTEALVETFDVDVQFALRHCFRTAHEFIHSDSSGENKNPNNKGAKLEVKRGVNDLRAEFWPLTALVDETDEAVMKIPEFLCRCVPLKWQEWIICVLTLRVNRIISHISYRDLSHLLKILATLTNLLGAENEIRSTLKARLDNSIWFNIPNTSGEDSNYADYFGAKHVSAVETTEQNILSGHYDALTRMSAKISCVQFCLINNIVDQASPVVEFETKDIELYLRAESNSMLEIATFCRVEAKYQNLRLVSMEPLIEPWSVKLVLHKQRISDLDDKVHAERSPWKLDVSSDTLLQLNLTDALIANLVAADRAWRWAVNAGGDLREINEHSTYWIRNNTGMPLRYWGTSNNEHLLAPGLDGPLRFNNVQFECGSSNDDKHQKRGRSNSEVSGRQLFIAVEENLCDNALNFKRKWQSEALISVDQVDSRMFALVDFQADIAAAQTRKCECVIDVLVERGCKYFVVRSTLILENQTSSDLEVEFVSLQVSMSQPSGSGRTLGEHTIPMWKKIVKAFTVVPVPLHIVSYGEGYLMVRPLESNITVAEGGSGTGTSPRAYAKERVYLPIFDRISASALENMTQKEVDESGQAQCSIKFRRLYSNRPVRPFMMNVCLSSASDALYYRTLTFYPPLIVHNLTAGSLDFCLATPSDWSPNNDAVTLANAGLWETREQRLRERGIINVADSLIWHLSSEKTPLVLSLRMKGFDWSETLELKNDLAELVQISMKDLVSHARLYISAELRISRGYCREVFLYVPYWIVNLTGLKLEYEYEKDQLGREHSITLLAGQKRLGRDELLLKENQGAKMFWRDRNPHLIYPVSVHDDEQIVGMRSIEQQSTACDRSVSSNRRDIERKRRHPRLLPSAPPIKGLLDLLPKSTEFDPRNLGQLDVLQACHSNFRRGRGCIRLRVGNEEDIAAKNMRKDIGQRKWSDPFVLDQVGTTDEIEAIDYEADRKFCIGISILPAKGHFSRTKVIMLTPRFVLINTTNCVIEVYHSPSKVSEINTTNANGSVPGSEILSPVNHLVQLEAGAFAEFHWTLRFAKTRTIRCRFAEHGWSWSGAVPLVESGEYAVRMRHESTRESRLVRITLKLDPPCICVYFREERTTTPPYRVENYSLETLRMHQHRVRRSEILLPHHSLDYAWDEPTEERLLVVDMLPSAAGDNSRPLRIGSFNLDRIERYPDALGGTLGIEISTDGPTRVLRFTDTRLREEKAVHASTNGQLEKTGTSESNALQLFKRYVTAPTVQAVLHLQGVGISIVDSAPKELVYISIFGISLEILISRCDRKTGVTSIVDGAAGLSRLQRENRTQILACCLEVNDIQIDNQLQITPYPVLLRFSNTSARSRIANGRGVKNPVVHVGLVKHDEYAGIDFIRHFSASILPVHVRVDGSLLYQILPLLGHFKVDGSSGIADAEPRKIEDVLRNGDSGATRAAHSHVLLKEFNASLAIPVKVLEAAHKDNTVSVGPTSGITAPAMNMVTRTNSNGPQSIIPRQIKRTVLPTEIQRHTTAMCGDYCNKKLYFEELWIDPIHATVSFSFGNSAGTIVNDRLSSLTHAAASTDPSSSQSSVITVGPLRLILNAIGTSLSKIANAPIHLKALHIYNSFVQPDALATRLATHYQSEALRQAYVILGSVDVLGNPMIAWKNLRNGLRDFVSKPAHGLSQRSPQAFAFGLGWGSLSLVRASVYTFLDFNTRILTAFSLGLSEACLKLDDYTGYPATRHIFQGLVQGLSGVVVAPIHSFEVNGARGVLPGLIAGLFGLVLKPLLGFSLATATTATTLRDAVDPNTKALLVRVRPPRHIDLRTKRLKIYSYVDSLGEEIVSKIRGGCYRADGYLGHIDFKATHQCFLVTRKRILFLNLKGIAPEQTTKYEIEWELQAEEVVMVDCSRTLDEQIVTIYYMENEFHITSSAMMNANGRNSVASSRRRISGASRGMVMHKHVVALPHTKVLFVRAMLQQQDRSLLTKMNCHMKKHHIDFLSSLARTDSMELNTVWPPHFTNASLEYPIFRIPSSLVQNRSFANL